jgi:hypothetical protein
MKSLCNAIMIYFYQSAIESFRFNFTGALQRGSLEELE